MGCVFPTSLLIILGPLASIVTEESTLLASDLATSDFLDHPLVQQVKQIVDDASTLYPNVANPNDYWMKQFLDDVIRPSFLPQSSSTFDRIRENVQRIAEYDQKGWLREVARGNVDLSELWFPNEDMRPLFLRGYTPVVTPDDPPPIIRMGQSFGDTRVLTELPTYRKKRSLEGEVEHEEIRPRVLKLSNHFSDDIAHRPGHDYHEVEEHEMDDNGEVINRKKREVPIGFGVYPPEGTAVFVAGIKVATDENDEIKYPD